MLKHLELFKASSGAAEYRERLESAFQDVVGDDESVCHLISRIEVKIIDIDPTTEDVKIEEIISNFFDEEMATKMNVSLTRRPLRGIQKAYVTLEEAWAFRLLKTVHIKMGWVSCRVHRKTVTNTCHSCLDFSHVAAYCG